MRTNGRLYVGETDPFNVCGQQEVVAAVWSRA